MLRRIKDLNGYKLSARDGEIGTVKDCYFDDTNWAVRYLIADTGDWLSERRVLISPYALDAADSDKKIIPVHLTKQQVEDSPSLESDKPVSRQFELQYYPYYNWPAYWSGDFMWGDAGYPDLALGGWSDGHGKTRNEDPHLRSTQEIEGYTIHGSDGDIGHVQDFVLDDKAWAIRYLIVDTRNWLPGKKVLISIPWVERIDWAQARVFLGLTRESIEKAPEFSSEALISREYETRLHTHYKREGYWNSEAAEEIRHRKAGR